MKHIRRFARILPLLTVISFPSLVLSAPTWNGGKITRVWPASEGVFVVTLDSSALSDCKHRYAYFRKSELGEGHAEALFATALTAFYLEQTVNIVIDKDENGEYCHGMSMDVSR